MKNVDSHAHVFKVGLPLAHVRRYAPSYDAKPCQYIERLDRHNMKIGVLIQPSFLGTDNSYMLSAINRYPDRLFGVAVIDPDTSLEQLEALKKQNIIGIRLNLYGVELPDLTAQVWQTCLARIKALDWHVELHYDAKGLKPFVDILLKAGVKVVIDHFGKLDTETMLNDEGFQYILSLGQTRRVWVKVSACYRLGGLSKGKEIAKTVFPKLLEAYGAKRLLWGSDWPHTQYEESVDYDKAYGVFEDIVADAKIRRIILQESFAELL